MSGQSRIAAGLAATSLSALALVGVSLAPARAATPQCTNGDLHATFHHTDSGAGHRFGRLVLTNVSHRACHTGGYGGLSYVGHGNGTQIGAAADRTSGTVRTVVLRPGQRVISEVSEAVAGNFSASTCRPTAVDGFRVYVPNATKSQFVVHRTTGCANAAVHLIAHKPFRRP
jgi:hypothetical protein